MDTGVEIFARLEKTVHEIIVEILELKDDTNIIKPLYLANAMKLSLIENGDIKGYVVVNKLIVETHTTNTNKINKTTITFDRMMEGLIDQQLNP